MSHRCWASQWIDTRVASPRDFLVTLRVFAVSNPSLLRGCLDVLLSCIYINRGDGVVLTRDPEGLGKVATTALLHVAACFSAIVHMPGPFNDVRQKYRGMYLFNTDSVTYHSLHYTMEPLYGMARSPCTHGFPYIEKATTLHFRNTLLWHGSWHCHLVALPTRWLRVESISMVPAFRALLPDTIRATSSPAYC